MYFFPRVFRKTKPVSMLRNNRDSFLFEAINLTLKHSLVVVDIHVLVHVADCSLVVIASEQRLC